MTPARGRAPGAEARAGRFPGPSLVPALHAIQERVGWLPREELESLARDTRRPLYEIQGLVSFYPHFRTEPPPAVALHLCHDLSCWLQDGGAGVADLHERYDGDADVEVREVSCLGRCEIAPAVAVDDRPARTACRCRRRRVGSRRAARRRRPGRTDALAQRPVRRRCRRATRCCATCSPAGVPLTRSPTP